MNNYQAYTYLIKFIPTGKVYYGVRFKNIKLKKTPYEDLMVNYKTSSKLIKKLIKEHGVESFNWEVRKIFNTSEDAIAWESKVLRRCKVLDRQDTWYNANVSGYKIITEIGRQTISKTHNGVPKTEEHKKKIGNALRGVPKTYVQSEETRRKNSEANSKEKHHRWGQKLSLEERAKCGEKNKGKVPYNKGTIKPQLEIDKAKETRNKNRKICPYCGNSFTRQMFTRYHGDKCKLKR